MAPDEVIKLTPQQHDKMIYVVKNWYQFLGGNNINLRAGLEYRDRLYYRETDWTNEQLKARWANYWGDAKKIQNMTVPVVAPQVETGVGYLTEVFCTGEPFFGVVATKDSADSSTQMEAVISDNSRRFGWRGEFIKFFRDGLKYNLMAMEMAWEEKKVFSIINDPTRAEKDSGKSAESMYAGNFAKRVDLYNMILDTRVRPNEIHTRGEFAGYVDLYPRTNLKQLVIDLGSGNTINVTDAFRSNCLSYTVGSATPGQYYIPLINPAALISPQNTGVNWLNWASGITNNGNIEYKDMYEVAVIYARFMPSDFGLNISSKNTPQIFKLIVVNQQHIIFCKRMTNAHNFLPIVVGQPFDDGLGYQAKSFGDNVAPYQEMASSLWNSGLESKRRLVYDRLFYDPSRISKTDIDRTSAVARIPVKAAAYGKPVSDAIFSANYRDDNVVGVLQMAQQVQQLAQVANGNNNVQQGQFQKGNKTRSEFETTMDRSNQRPRLFAITIEDTVMAPLKEIVKMNIIQFQGPAQLFSQPTQTNVQVNPQDLRKAAFQFKLSDGQTPTDKLLNMDVLSQVAQLGMAVPAINAEYDIPGMLLFGFKQMGAFWLNDFKRTPEQQQQFLQATQATTNAQTPASDKAHAQAAGSSAAAAHKTADASQQSAQAQMLAAQQGPVQ